MMDCSDCESVCCYDGVSLQFDEVLAINKFVEENKEYFSFLPEKYIDGNRVITRKQEYKNDFPDHLPKTRCIFGLENGYCSLQARSIELGIHQWKIKPEPCWLFPLRAEANELVFPHTKGAREYDAFMKCFPCGKKKSKKAWKEMMQEEISYFNKSLIKKTVGVKSKKIKEES